MELTRTRWGHTCVANRSFGSVAKLKYLITAATQQNIIGEESKRRMKVENGYCCAFHSLFPV
jgi:hypothetical protein